MKHAIVILLTLLVPSSVFATPPDLCAEDVYLNTYGDPLSDSWGQTLSRYCEWTGPGVPVWNADVCCSIDAAGAACSVPGRRGTCGAGLGRYHCEYGKQYATGVVCYQPFPSTCSLGTCSNLAPPDDAQEGVICCSGGACFPWDDQNYEDCGGIYTWCNDGYSNVDGTVDCFG
jgi:hypothetical protein